MRITTQLCEQPDNNTQEPTQMTTVGYPDKMWEKLQSHLQTHSKDFEEGLAEKISYRGMGVHDPNHPNKLVFDVERHRAWLGERYEPGQPMGSFITYFMRFVYDPVKDTLESIGNVRPSKFTVGAWDDSGVEGITFDFNRQDDGSILVSAVGFNSEATVTNLQEAEQFAAGIVEAWNLVEDVASLKDALAPGQQTECLLRMREVLTNQILEKLRRYWHAMEAETARQPSVRRRGHRSKSRAYPHAPGNRPLQRAS